MSLGEKIKLYRKKMKLSQEELGELIGVTRQTISNWELEDSAPDISQAKELAKIFEISLEELVNDHLENTLLKKITHTKTIATVSLGISILHFLLFISIIIICLVTIFRYYKVSPTKQSVEINCHIKDINYYYRLDLDIETNKIISFDTNDNDLLETFEYQKDEKYTDVLNRIENTVIQKGGKCN